jgi:hypothetical protein
LHLIPLDEQLLWSNNNPYGKLHFVFAIIPALSFIIFSHIKTETNIAVILCLQISPHKMTSNRSKPEKE